jgi:hypothetical protein
MLGAAVQGRLAISPGWSEKGRGTCLQDAQDPQRVTGGHVGSEYLLGNAAALPDKPWPTLAPSDGLGAAIVTDVQLGATVGHRGVQLDDRAHDRNQGGHCGRRGDTCCLPSSRRSSPSVSRLLTAMLSALPEWRHERSRGFSGGQKVITLAAKLMVRAASFARKKETGESVLSAIMVTLEVPVLAFGGNAPPSLSLRSGGDRRAAEG